MRIIRRSRHVAHHAAKALPWRVEQLLKCLIKKITLYVCNGVLYSKSALGFCHVTGKEC